MLLIERQFAVQSLYLKGDIVRIEDTKFYPENGLKDLHFLHLDIGKGDAGRLQVFTKSRTP